ncbi:hypothetical protein [Nostoc parmelioides]|uniref:DUF4376 domain-containing protein n=1 Tax=Nostoc parmelioides FACHB-3921 TaxID=2692909 RepID=A0ABR8BI12_9NOSO|nr:hypothetical protein [Nostoc parmelioides]MBD2253329.1 hypothetical protein [Nostoc parmelioides FACHB-3921]
MTYIAHTQQPTSKQTLVQAVAPELLTSREIDFYEHELYIGERLVARIVYDDADFVTQRWVVMVNNAEVFRRSWWQKCFDDTQWHYSRGKLPVQEPETPTSTTDNEIMVQIFDACEQCGLELLDDGIYTRDGEKLGQVGWTKGNWWVIQASSVGQQKATCESAIAGVRSLLQAEVVGWDELLDKAFDELTADEWLLMMESEPVSELVAA